MTKKQIDSLEYVHENGSYSNNNHTENNGGISYMTTNVDYDDAKDEHQPSSDDNTRRPIRTTSVTTYYPPPIPKPNLAEMKHRRVRNQTLGGWIGGAVGLLLLSIPGAILGAIVGNKLTKHHLKREERQAMEAYEYRIAQLNATVQGGSTSAVQTTTSSTSAVKVI